MIKTAMNLRLSSRWNIADTALNTKQLIDQDEHLKFSIPSFTVLISIDLI